MHKEKYIGIMSGTSLDAVDVVLCEIDQAHCTLLHSIEYPFPSELKAGLLRMISGTCTLEEVGRADHALGLLFTEAVAALLLKFNIEASSIKAIGSHGQTLWHAPEGDSPFSMQLGDPNILTAKTGIAVVADFRRKDVALGGQGAPFAPAFHAFAFKHIKPSLAVINIGGMANITVLDETLIGYDTGCGNVLMDLWIQKHKSLAYDKDGQWAKEGKVDETLLTEMLSDPYFAQVHPKSTGREKFNGEWLENMLTRRGIAMSLPSDRDQQVGKHKGKHIGLPLRDVQRTLLELTAVSIANEVLKFNTEQVLLCGGGAKNTFLRERIQSLLPELEVGIAPYADEIEAMTFAWLAYKRLHKEKVNLKEVTGASENAVLGGLYE